MSRSLFTVPIAHVRPNPDQPRKRFGKTELDELTASICEHGVLLPVLVRADPMLADEWILVAGERRWRAATAAGLTDLPAVATSADADDAFVLSVVENVNRQDMTPMEEARGYRTLLDQGRSRAEVARLCGKTTRWVQLFLDLLDALPQVQQLLDDGGIEFNVANAFAHLSPAGQQVALRKYLAGDFRQARDAQHYATVVRQHEAMDGLFDEPLTEETRALHLRTRKQADTLLDKITKAHGACQELNRIDQDLLRAALAGAGGAAAYRDKLQHLITEANRALSTMRRAAAEEQVRADLVG